MSTGCFTNQWYHPHTHTYLLLETHIWFHIHTHTQLENLVDILGLFFSLIFILISEYFLLFVKKKKSSNCGKFYLVSHLLLNNEKPMSFNVTITLCVMHSVHLDFKIQGYILLASCFSIVFSLALKKLKLFVFIPPIVFPFPLGWSARALFLLPNVLNWTFSFVIIL